jgi:ribosome-binding ATPase YchF (GTP1/OBG family)
MEKMPNLLTSKPVIYLVNMSASDFIRKKNKWLPKIHQWVQEHGGGVMIPFSVEWEAKLWELRDNASAKQVGACMCAGEGGGIEVWMQLPQLYVCCRSL